MFVKKLVEKASMKKPGTVSGGLKAEDIDPRLVFHYGIPSGAVRFAFDSIQKILAIATKDGRIKLFGKDGTQALLEHSETVPSKFLEFMENRGILININASNHIEVWDVARKELTHTYEFEREITSYSVLQHTPYMFVGDSNGNVSVMKHSEEANQIEHMQYRIPYSPSHGNSGEISSENAVTHVLPQPLAESKRLVIVYKDGLIVLWSIQESRTVFTTGATAFQSISHEAKQVTAASWACPTGSKIAVGYNNGEIFIWSIPAASNLKSDQGTDKDLRDSVASQSAPICKLNLGYKLDKIPISKLRWLYVDGKASRLYVMGFSSAFSANLMQVLLLNEKSESRTIKVGLNPPETCIDFNIMTGFYGQGKQKNDAIMLLGKSGQIYYYDDSLVERYLLLSQSKSSPSLPKEEMVKLPFAKTRITVSFFVSDNPVMRCSSDQDYMTFTTDILQLFPFQTNPKDASVSNQSHSSGFSKAKNLYITGHDNGAIDFWDISWPLLSPIVSLTQQSEDDLSVSGVPLVSLYFDLDQRLLISGDQNGTVRIYKLKSEVFIPESGFLSLPGGSKKGGNHIIKSIKLLKVNGAALCINTGNNAKHLAVGSDQGYVSLFDMEGQTLLYQNHIASELCTGIMSLQFGNCSIQGFDKNLLMVATKDSSVLAFESETGNSLSSSVVCPKSPSRALYMQILDGYDISSLGSNIMDVLDMSKGTAETASRKQQVLLMCSERAVYVYSLSHAVQGIKKVIYKKKFHSTCCWASTFESPEAGVILLFSTGQIDIRSLPELSHLRTFSVRGLTLSVPKANSIPNHSVCSSHNGDLVVV
ncbi:hypothetical protein Leryth_013829 [Lithospermum erythrorhizon]|nr:hypothetical protein Leryth_013829 [Lithospermum erythrorhizon]